MAVTVITFPGSNCDRDCVAGVESAGGVARRVFHKEHELPADTDAIILPGGFSFGDYLRCGAMAARSHIMGAVRRFADAGGPVLGICNGFQILCEAQMLPGALLRNAEGRFVCEEVELDIVGDSPLLVGYQPGDGMVVPVAHGEGNYTADDDTLAMLERERRVAFRYRDLDASGNAKVNGARRGIAGIIGGPKRNILGMMPHPERRASTMLGGDDGLPLLLALVGAASPLPSTSNSSKRSA
jgi:phosphoribosylformylglycinamidine synthase